MGGTYAEVVTVPDDREDASGSGMRAAAALAADDIPLLTAVDQITAGAASAAAATLGVERVVSERDQPVRFRYFTPVSSPTIDGLRAQFAEPLSADDSTVLVFGMLEQGEVSVHAEKLVFDPQQPRDLTALDMTQFRYSHLAIIANSKEAATLAGDQENITDNARLMLARYGAEVVVVKDSARGGVVATAGGAVRVGPHPTPSVWPIGSGDVFAAGFAHAWDRGADPIEAAHVASNCAAWWCGTRSSAVPAEILAGRSVNEVLKRAGAELKIPEILPTLYLAAPFFTLAERWLVELSRDVASSLGAHVFSPLHDVGRGGIEVAKRDLAGLRESAAVLALLDGWDPGTMYELGWAHRHDLPVVGFVNEPPNSGAKMLAGTGAEIGADLSTALYRSVWAANGLSIMPDESECL